MPLTVEVKRATNLPWMEAYAWEIIKDHSLNDPFCELTFNGQRQTTKPLCNTQWPQWNEKLEWTLEAVPSADDLIKVVIVDHMESGWHLEMCTATIPLIDVLKKGSDIDRELEITFESLGKGVQYRKDHTGVELKPMLFVNLTYKPPSSATLRGKLETELKQTKDQNSEAIKALREKVNLLEMELKQTKGLKAEVSEGLVKIRQHRKIYFSVG